MSIRLKVWCSSHIYELFVVEQNNLKKNLCSSLFLLLCVSRPTSRLDTKMPIVGGVHRRAKAAALDTGWLHRPGLPTQTPTKDTGNPLT